MHGVLMQIGKETPIPMHERFNPISERQFDKKYGRHVSDYLALSEKGTKTITEKPPLRSAEETEKWFGKKTNRPQN